MTASIVQAKTAAPTNTGCSVTFGVAPTNGSLLIALVSAPSSDANIMTAAAGWTFADRPQVLFGGIGNGGIYYKFAGAAESTTQTPLSTGRTKEFVTMFEIGTPGGTWAELYQPFVGGDTNIIGSCNAAYDNYDRAPATYIAPADRSLILLFSAGVHYFASPFAPTNPNVAIPTPSGLSTIVTGTDNNTTNIAGVGYYGTTAASTRKTVTMTWNNTDNSSGAIPGKLETMAMLCALRGDLTGGAGPTDTVVTTTVIAPSVAPASFRYTILLP